MNQTRLSCLQSFLHQCKEIEKILSSDWNEQDTVQLAWHLKQIQSGLRARIMTIDEPPTIPAQSQDGYRIVNIPTRGKTGTTDCFYLQYDYSDGDGKPKIGSICIGSRGKVAELDQVGQLNIARVLSDKREGLQIKHLDRLLEKSDDRSG